MFHTKREQTEHKNSLRVKYFNIKTELTVVNIEEIKKDLGVAVKRRSTLTDDAHAPRMISHLLFFIITPTQINSFYVFFCKLCLEADKLLTFSGVRQFLRYEKFCSSIPTVWAT